MTCYRVFDEKQSAFCTLSQQSVVCILYSVCSLQSALCILYWLVYILYICSCAIDTMVLNSIMQWNWKHKPKLVSHYLRNRKHVPCFYWVIKTWVEVWENEKCCGNASCRWVIPQLFRVLPNFHEYFYNLTETQRTCFLFLLKTLWRKNKNSLFTLIIKM